MTCGDCGKKIGRDLWLDDNALLCGGCAQTRRITNARRNQIEEERRATEAAHGHDHVEGRQGEGR